MPRYVPEDSLKSPRFTGPSTFARLPYVRTLEDVDVAIVGRAIRHRRDLPGRRPVRAERRSCRERDAAALQRQPGREAVRRPVLRGLRGHRHRAGLHGAQLRRHRGGREPHRGGGRGPAAHRRRPCLHAAAPARHALARAGGGHRLRLPHRRLGQLLRREVQPRDVDAPRDRGGAGRRRPLDRGGPARLALRRRRLDRAADGAGARLPHDRGRVRARAGGGGAAIRERVGDRPAFISFDIDVVDPAYAPGTGTPEAGWAVGARHARDRSAPDRHRLRRASTWSRSSPPTTRPARRRRSPRISPTRCCRSSPSSAARAADGMDGSAPAWRTPMPPGFRWPDGFRAAACFTFDVDAESPILFEHPESADWLDVMTHQAYGPRTGGRPHPARPRPAAGSGRRSSSPATAPSAGRTTVRSIRDAGHEIAHHGYLHEGAHSAPTRPTRSDGCCAGSRRSTRSSASARSGYRAPEVGADVRRRPRSSPATASCTTPG